MSDFDTALEKIYNNQGIFNLITGSETYLNDFILKGMLMNIPREFIINGLTKFFRQTKDSAEGIFSRLEILLETKEILKNSYLEIKSNLINS